MSGAEKGRQGGPDSPRGRAVAAFIELVAERGYQNVELSEVDARAGLAPGSAAGYYPDRLAYFGAGWEFLERQFEVRLRAAYEPEEGWRNRLRAAAGEAAALLESFPAQAHFLAIDSLSVGEAGRARQQALAARLAVVLDDARQESEGAEAAPTAASGWVISVFFDRIYRYISTGRESQFAADLPELMFLAVSSYFGPEAGLEELGRPR